MLVLDAGALVALARADPLVGARVNREIRLGREPITHAGIVGQVWRGGRGRQTNLARALASVLIVDLDDRLARSAGILLGLARMNDVLDAALVLLAIDGDEVLTSDAPDIGVLASFAGLHVDVVPV